MATGFDVVDENWSGWTMRRDRDWQQYAPSGTALPEQGWKLHVSSTPADGPVTLRAIAAVCRVERWTFKHLVDRSALERANDKDAARASSGKFITVYPPSTAVTADLLDQLASVLGTLRGPRILGDLQWKGTPVHVRFGAFRPLETWDGIAAVRRPDGGLEPDLRGVTFAIPPWVATPKWVETELERQREADIGELARLRITGAYSFSNSGGVYRGDHDEHGSVVVKEGRELVAVHHGADAASRIENEAAVLRHLGATGVAPRVFGTFRSGGSAFLMMERLDGVPFNRAIMSRNPLTHARPTRDALAQYERSVAAAIASVDRSLSTMHDAGIVHGDISPRNVMLGDDGSVRFVDFESAHRRGEQSSTLFGTPGFAAPSSIVGTARDRFALACLHLAALLPLTSLIPLDIRKTSELLDAAAKWFPAAPTEELRAVFSSMLDLHRAGDGREARVDDLAAGIIRRSIDTIHARRDGLEHGPLGVRLALARAEHAHGTAPSARPAGHDRSIGLFAGRAAALLGGGDDSTVIRALEREIDSTERVDVDGGLAGIGLALLSAAPSPEREPLVCRVADRLVAFAMRSDDATRLRPGLASGPTGLALFLAMHGRRSGDERSTAAAVRLIEIDVDRLERSDDGEIQIAHEGRLVPFLATGSAGVGIALLQLRRATGDDAHLAAIPGIVEAASPRLTAHAGLLNGRAGLMHFLVDAVEYGVPAVDRDEILDRLLKHRRDLRLHRLEVDTGTAYPDARLRTVDDGFGHGGAGVLSALAATEQLVSRASTDGSSETGRRSDLPSFLRGTPA